MSEQNKAIVEQAYNNFKTGNIEALLNLMVDDVTWTLPEMEGAPFGGKRTGRAAVAEFFATVNTSQEPLRFEPRELIAEGDKVVALGSYEWRVRASGREFGADFAHAWTIQNGKVVAFHEYTDTAACANAYRKAMSA
ncbi:MAG TPA: ketosteroid isomerase [Blastocatellia bacterium]|jgi:ketosteroid isomerase-like protein|nr:ketosteroid isomerase [Blastocatellia bacterium]HAF22661.1 ketosteroid isomerase [Blastocatellia bacterium]HCX30615.1 ketosteroid isomerase [Blastocatellia bacterium]